MKSTFSASRIRASARWPIRHFAMTGIETACWISRILETGDIRATPPSRRMSAGTRSRAITAAAPACSAILACSALTTSMMTPPLSISARPTFTRKRVVLVHRSSLGAWRHLFVLTHTTGADCAGSRSGSLPSDRLGQKRDPRLDLPAFPPGRPRAAGSDGPPLSDRSPLRASPRRPARPRLRRPAGPETSPAGAARRAGCRPPRPTRKPRAGGSSERADGRDPARFDLAGPGAARPAGRRPRAGTPPRRPGAASGVWKSAVCLTRASRSMTRPRPGDPSDPEARHEVLGERAEPDRSIRDPGAASGRDARLGLLVTVLDDQRAGAERRASSSRIAGVARSR